MKSVVSLRQMTLDDLRNAALNILKHALHAVDARLATRNAVSLDQSILRVAESEFNLSDRPIYVLGVGKAALSMTLGLHDVLGDRIFRAVISTPASAAHLPSTYNIFLGGHPLPNQQSLDAATAAFELLRAANREKAVVIFLVSGGGSAMMEWPAAKEISLDDLQQTNRKLVASGATISEINTIRRSLSAVKGGALIRLVPDAQVVTLITSDTNSGDEANVASGPTLPFPACGPDAATLIEKYDLVSTLPPSVVKVIRQIKPTKSLRQGEVSCPSYVLLDSGVALKAAKQKAVELGFMATVEYDIVEQAIEKGSELLLTRLSEQRSCSISGGEFSCRVMGNGRGGRNLETVLRCALKLDADKHKANHHTAILSAGTDGIDGSSNAAGAIADEETIGRAKVLGLDARRYLQTSDSHAFFEKLGDLIVTGPTGTNVRDLRLVMRCKSQI
jgi:glycerate 2-kinase